MCVEQVLSNGSPNVPDLNKFLERLTALSQECGIGIAGQPTLFLTQDGDENRTYSVDDASDLSFI